MKKPGKFLGPSENSGDVEPNILRAAFNNNVHELRAAIESNPDCVREIEPASGGTPLHIAAYKGNVDVMRALLGVAGLDVAAKDGLGREVAEVAIASGHAEICRLIFEYEARHSGLSEPVVPTAEIIPLKPKP